jgi:Domain of unknown function (DUF5753)
MPAFCLPGCPADATMDAVRGQFRHLIDTTAKPNFTIQVIPSATAIRTTLGYPITLLRFRVHEVPDVAYYLRRLLCDF